MRVFFFINLIMVVSDAFFLFTEKEPIFLCFKICPLYCSPRRHDLDSSSLIYIDDEPPPYDRPYYYDDHDESPHHGYYVFCKYEPKPTTPKPTTTTTMATTTEEPTWICMVCMDKCNTKAKSKRK